MVRNRDLGGGALFLAGSFFGKETIIWVWSGVLDAVTAGAGDRVSWQTFPWANAIGVTLMIVGLAVLAWPLIPRRGSGVLSYDDTKLRTEVENLAKTVGTMVADRGRIDEAESRLARVEKTAAKVEQAEWEARLKSIQDTLDRMTLPKPTEANSAGFRDLLHDRDVKLTEMEAFTFGRAPELSKYLTGMKEALDPILQHAKYRDVSGKEDSMWADGDQKQLWHLVTAKAKFIADAVRRARNDGPP